jgi:hypothetical protein
MAIAWAQSTKARTASGLSQTTSGLTTQATGSIFVIAAQWSRNSGTFSSVSDSKGNTYTLIDTQLDWEGVNGGWRLYYCENGTGGASHTATFTLTGSNGPITIFFGEITGALTSGSLDQHIRREDTASPFTLAAGLTTTQADEIVVSFVGGNSGSNPATHAESGLGSSTIQTASEETNGSTFWTAAIATAVKSSTGTFNPSWTESGASAMAVGLATFKAASAGAPAYPSRLTLTGAGR